MAIPNSEKNNHTNEHINNSNFDPPKMSNADLVETLRRQRRDYLLKGGMQSTLTQSSAWDASPSTRPPTGLNS